MSDISVQGWLTKLGGFYGSPLENFDSPQTEILPLIGGVIIGTGYISSFVPTYKLKHQLTSICVAEIRRLHNWEILSSFIYSILG